MSAYITKKKVDKYIAYKLKYTFKNKREFKKELNIVLANLSDTKGTPFGNQFKFFSKVKEALN